MTLLDETCDLSTDSHICLQRACLHMHVHPHDIARHAMYTHSWRGLDAQLALNGQLPCLQDLASSVACLTDTLDPMQDLLKILIDPDLVVKLPDGQQASTTVNHCAAGDGGGGGVYALKDNPADASILEPDAVMLPVRQLTLPLHQVATLLLLLWYFVDDRQCMTGMPIHCLTEFSL